MRREYKIARGFLSKHRKGKGWVVVETDASRGFCLESDEMTYWSALAVMRRRTDEIASDIASGRLGVKDV